MELMRAMAAIVRKSAYEMRLRRRAEKLHKDAEALNGKKSSKILLEVRTHLREITMVKGGNDEGKTKKAVEKVSEGQMKD